MGQSSFQCQYSLSSSLMSSEQPEYCRWSEFWTLRNTEPGENRPFQWPIVVFHPAVLSISRGPHMWQLKWWLLTLFSTCGTCQQATIWSHLSRRGRWRRWWEWCEGRGTQEAVSVFAESPSLPQNTSRANADSRAHSPVTLDQLISEQSGFVSFCARRLVFQPHALTPKAAFFLPVSTINYESIDRIIWQFQKLPCLLSWVKQEDWHLSCIRRVNIWREQHIYARLG